LFSPVNQVVIIAGPLRFRIPDFGDARARLPAVTDLSARGRL